MFPETFEKDDDSNSHIDFITAASVRHYAHVLSISFKVCANSFYDL